MAEEKTAPAPVVAVDNQGFVKADGVCLGRLTSDGLGITVVDRDRQRSARRGTRYVVVPLTELSKVTPQK